jgi:hypothetical protein
LEGLHSAEGKGIRADRGFKKLAWEPILMALCRAYLEIMFELRQLKSKADSLKGKYCKLQAYYNTSGFGYNSEKTFLQLSHKYGQHILL